MPAAEAVPIQVTNSALCAIRVGILIAGFKGRAEKVYEEDKRKKLDEGFEEDEIGDVRKAKEGKKIKR